MQQFGMRFLLGLIACSTLAGCFGFVSKPYDRCANGPGLGKPYGFEVYEERKPEAGGPIIGEAPPSSVSPSHFDADRWGERVLPTLPARAAPDVAPPELLVCDLQTVAVEGIDDSNTVFGRLYRSSIPDLMVWARFDGVQFARGPRSSTTRATFAFRTELHEGDPVIFIFGDHDFFSENDLIGKIQGNYFGKLPFEIKGKLGSATCNAASAPRLAEEADRARQLLESLLVSFEKHTPTLAEPLPEELFAPIADALGAIELFAGNVKEEKARANERLKEATGGQWATYARMLEKKRSSLPRAGTWVALGDEARARVPGLRCQVGDKLVKSCDPILEVQLLKDPDLSRCTADETERLADPLEALGKMVAIASDGRESSVLKAGVMVGPRWLSEEAEIWKLKKGDIMRVPLSIGGLHPTHTNWAIPMIRIGETYLRVD